jgi:aminopeptidase-like protein
MARTVYGEYDGYHNSHDDKEFMGIEPLVEAAETIERVLARFEYAGYYRNCEPYGEPMLSKRNLYPDVNSPETWSDSAPDIRDDEGEFLDKVLTVLNYADGSNSLVDIADRYGSPLGTFVPVVDRLQSEDLLERTDGSEPSGKQ